MNFALLMILSSTLRMKNQWVSNNSVHAATTHFCNDCPLLLTQMAYDHCKVLNRANFVLMLLQSQMI